MRADQVAQGVNFLRHPDVQTSPMSQRVAFLESKGLTQEEIAESIARAEGSGSGVDEGESAFAGPVDSIGPGNAGRSSQVVVTGVPKLSTWKKTALAIGGLGVLGGATYGIYPYITASKDFAKKNEEEESELKKTMKVTTEELHRLNEQMESRTNDVVQAVDDIKALMTEQGDKLRQTHLDRNISDGTMITELGTIKRLLLQMKAESDNAVAAAAKKQREAQEASSTSTLMGCNSDGTSNGAMAETASDDDVKGHASGGDSQTTDINDAKSTTEQIIDEEEAVAVLSSERADKLAAVNIALNTLWANNKAEQMKTGLPMLRLYLHNLTADYSVPRYRRVCTTNVSFKNFVQPLTGHLELLESVGFSGKGSYMEWRWHSTAAEETESNKTIMGKALIGLDAMIQGQPPPDVTVMDEEVEQDEEQKGEQQREDDGGNGDDDKILMKEDAIENILRGGGDGDGRDSSGSSSGGGGGGGFSGGGGADAAAADGSVDSNSTEHMVPVGR